MSKGYTSAESEPKTNFMSLKNYHKLASVYQLGIQQNILILSLVLFC